MVTEHNSKERRPKARGRRGSSSFTEARTRSHLLQGRNSSRAQRPEDARSFNRALVYRCIWEHDSISRSDLSRTTGLSAPVITAIVAELIDAALVRESGHRDSTGGRRSMALSIDVGSWNAVAIDIARHRTTLAVIDPIGNVLKERVTTTSNSADPHANLRWLIGLISDLLSSVPRSKGRLLAIGIGAPGPLHAETGEILNVTDFGDWHDLDLRMALERRFNVPVRVENDANVCAIAQRFFGVGRDVEDFVYLALGSGVGAGVFVGGHLYRGSNWLAGEIGHTTIDVRGPTCPCGNIGCLELFTTVSAAMARWPGAPQDRVDGDEVMAIQALDDAAKRGDEGALAAIAQTAAYVAAGVVNVVNFLDPEVVIVGRELGQLGSLLIDPIRRAVASRTFPDAQRTIRVESDPLGASTPVRGAFCLILQELVDSRSPLLEGMVAAGRRSPRANSPS